MLRKKTQIILSILTILLIVASVSASPNYLKIAQQSAEWIRASTVKKENGIIWLADPNDKKSESFDIYSGSPGVVLFFMELAKSTKNKSYLNFTKRITDNLLSRSTKEGKGIKWIQAENRTQPNLLIAQTGFMQGASGIGMYLLRLKAAEQSRKTSIVFPDTPF